MSQNFQLLLESFRQFEAGELDERAFDEDAVITAPDEWPEQGPFNGRAAIMRQFDRLAEDWSIQRATDVKLIRETEDWVVAEWRWQTRGSSSGIEATFDMAGAFRLEGARLIEAHYRWNAADAIEAAGLS